MIPAVDDGVRYYSPTIEASHNPVHHGGDVLLVRRAGSAVSVIDDWNETSEAVSFLVNAGPGRRLGSVNLRDLNVKETTRVNRERGIEFKMPIDRGGPNLPLMGASGGH